MTNAELIAKIKTEVERRKTIQLKRIQEGDMVDSAPYDKNEAYNELLSFLSTLESEKPMNLEEEIGRTYHDGSVTDTSDLDHNSYENIARYFAQWQKEQMMKGAVEYEVGMHGEPITVNLDKYVQRARGIFPGDKVRVIVLPKQDEK